jgi:hypothetical protein
MKRLAVLLMALPLFACESDGPFERAAEEVDEAIEDVKAGGETAGNQIDDAIDDVQEGIEDAVEEVEDTVD